MEEKKFNLILSDSITAMKQLIENGIKLDMILCDLPYGTTACAWDSILPMDELWTLYKQLIKPNGAIVLTASQPFTSALVMANADGLKHHWVWDKGNGTGFQVAKYRPMMQTEDILVFTSKGETVNYYPQKPKRKTKLSVRGGIRQSGSSPLQKDKVQTREYDDSYPTNLLYYERERGLHPTQKPVELFKYLVKTYSMENDLVMDNTMGSGTTGVACMHLDRRFIGIEKEQEYFTIAESRISAVANQIKLF
jgi:site-specific DNA-methyltransferase (adenine-specific)